MLKRIFGGKIRNFQAIIPNTSRGIQNVVQTGFCTLGYISITWNVKAAKAFNSLSREVIFLLKDALDECMRFMWL